MDKDSQSWAEKAEDLIAAIERTQKNNISRASSIIADSIACGHAAFLFGSGHSALPVEEIYPRYGGIVGFLPMIELPLSYFTAIVGNLGFSQFDYLENNPDYGSSILRSYSIHKEDCLIAFTHSGSTPVTVEIALRFKEVGKGKIIGVTSLKRARGSMSKHPSGKGIHDISDVTIDTGVPDSDVSISVQNKMVGPLSTIGAVTVANMLSIETAKTLAARGIDFLVNPVRAFDPDSPEKMNSVLKRYRQLYADHIVQ